MSTSPLYPSSHDDRIAMSMEESKDREGMVPAIILTILVLASFLAGSLYYVAFYTEGYSLFQKVAVILIALIVAVAAVSIVWVVWAAKRGLIRPDWTIR